MARPFWIKLKIDLQAQTTTLSSSTNQQIQIKQTYPK